MIDEHNRGLKPSQVKKMTLPQLRGAYIGSAKIV